MRFLIAGLLASLVTRIDDIEHCGCLAIGNEGWCPRCHIHNYPLIQLVLLAHPDHGLGEVMYRLVAKLVEGRHRIVNPVERPAGHGLELNQQFVQIRSPSRELQIIMPHLHAIQAFEAVCVGLD